MMENKIEEVVEKASMSFWATVAKNFPELKSGDLGIDTTFQLKIMMERAVAEWVEGNR
ncbi:MAG: hypothetical protein ACTS9Y_00625 [Methylophilus sp.]|uniref:hypothetical protein n=1 Tax=Methylophilus sp. TaxID=29541 RepID=UPI003F9F0B25